MGQVWSKADFDGMTELGHQGGCGSVLAVTAQNPGRDGVYGGSDDLLAPLGQTPVSTSIDANAGPHCADKQDRVRGFHSLHQAGAYFVYADGSVHMINSDIDTASYIALSTIDSGDIAQP